MMLTTFLHEPQRKVADQYCSSRPEIGSSERLQHRVHSVFKRLNKP